MTELRCLKRGATQPADAIAYTCPHCGPGGDASDPGILAACYDYAAAARALRDGASLETVMAMLERLRSLVSIRFSVATLEFLRKNGRIGAAAALLGGLLSIKPMLEYHDGVMNAVGRPRGAKRALQDTVAGVRDYVARYGPSRAWFIYTQSREDVEPLRDACVKLGIQEVRTYQAGAVITSHIGPHAYAVCLEPLQIL